MKIVMWRFSALRNEIAEAFCSMEPLCHQLAFASFIDRREEVVQREPGMIRKAQI
jgi:hypothetical protein